MKSNNKTWVSAKQQNQRLNHGEGKTKPYKLPAHCSFPNVIGRVKIEAENGGASFYKASYMTDLPHLPRVLTDL